MPSPTAANLLTTDELFTEMFERFPTFVVAWQNWDSEDNELTDYIMWHGSVASVTGLITYAAVKNDQRLRTI